MAGQQFSVDLFGHNLLLDQSEQLEDRNWKSMLGRWAEFLLCAQLTKLGYYVTHVDMQGFDLLLEYEGKPYRIQVKSTSRSAVGRQSTIYWNTAKHTRTANGRGHQPLGEKDADLLALFYNPLEVGIFLPVIDPMQSGIYARLASLKTEMMEKSLIAAIHQKRGRI